MRFAAFFSKQWPIVERERWGVMFRPGSLWIGAHWSPYNRRWCINLLPTLTAWFTLPGGKTPGGKV